jgi:CSLREA domain-containing protein
MSRNIFDIRLLTAVFLFLTSLVTQAGTITVNSTSDAATNDGLCTLREAIIAANTNIASGAAAGECAAGGAAPVTINFNVTGAGCVGNPAVCTIAPGSALPEITTAVLIDGYTQPTSAPAASPNTLAIGNDAVLLIEIDGTNAGGKVLKISGNNASGSTIRGLVINRSQVAISLGASAASSNNKVIGNFIGSTLAGSFMPSGQQVWIAIEILSGGSNQIGSAAPADRNLIVGLGGPTNEGLVHLGGSGANAVAGNYIGTNAAGTVGLQNTPSGAGEGVTVASPGNIIGVGNVIATLFTGILLTADGNTIWGNLIGTDATGTTPLFGGGSNIAIGGGFGVAANNTIGGTGPGQENVLSGGWIGIDLLDVGAGWLIQNNKIGTDKAGTTAIPNDCGIRIGSIGGGTGGGTGSGTIGGSNQGSLVNVIAFNRTQGVAVGDGTWEISNNSIHSNGGLGITLGSCDSATPPTPNDLGDADTGPNGLQNYPVLTSVTEGSGVSTISGTLNSTANTTFQIEFYTNVVCHPSGYGEGQKPLGSHLVTTDGSGNVAFGPVTFNTVVGQQVYTATATPVSIAGEPVGTSEFSKCITAPAAAPPPTIAKNFGAATIVQSDTTTLNFTITNQAQGNGGLSGVAFTDVLPSGLLVGTPNGLNGSCGGGTITASAGTSSVSLSGGALAAGGSCSFSVNVIALLRGTMNNSVRVSSNEGGAGNTANATMNVVAGPGITKTFAASSIPLNGSTTLRFVLGNGNNTNLGFVDTLPAGLVVSTPNGLTGS